MHKIWRELKNPNLFTQPIEMKTRVGIAIDDYPARIEGMRKGKRETSE